MQNDILTPTPEGKVYKTQSIIIATFFGGLFAAAFLIAGNFKTLGQKQKMFSTWVYCVLLLLVLAFTSFVPALDRIPGIAYTIAVTALIAAYVNAQQKNKIDEHIENGGEVHAGVRVFLVALVGLLITVALVLLSFWLADMAVTGEQIDY